MSKKNNDIDYEKVALRAYHIWNDAGRPDGRHQEHWLQAEAEIREQLNAAASKAKSPAKKAPAKKKAAAQKELGLNVPAKGQKKAKPAAKKESKPAAKAKAKAPAKKKAAPKKAAAKAKAPAKKAAAKKAAPKKKK